MNGKQARRLRKDTGFKVHDPRQYSGLEWVTVDGKNRLQICENKPPQFRGMVDPLTQVVNYIKVEAGVPSVNLGTRRAYRLLKEHFTNS